MLGRFCCSFPKTDKACFIPGVCSTFLDSDIDSCFFLSAWRDARKTADVDDERFIPGVGGIMSVHEDAVEDVSGIFSVPFLCFDGARGGTNCDEECCRGCNTFVLVLEDFELDSHGMVDTDEDLCDHTSISAKSTIVLSDFSLA